MNRDYWTVAFFVNFILSPPIMLILLLYSASFWGSLVLWVMIGAHLAFFVAVVRTESRFPLALRAGGWTFIATMLIGLLFGASLVGSLIMGGLLGALIFFAALSPDNDRSPLGQSRHDADSHTGSSRKLSSSDAWQTLSSSGQPMIEPSKSFVYEPNPPAQDNWAAENARQAQENWVKGAMTQASQNH